MAATAMATTISTLAATSMVKAESNEPVAVTCACPAPAEPPIVPRFIDLPSSLRPLAEERSPEAPAPAEVAPVEVAPAEVAPAQAEERLDNADDPLASRARARSSSRAPQAEVEGALDRDIIRRIVRAHITEVRDCYDEGLSRDPELAGRVVVDFVIGPEGKVTRATAGANFEGEVPECIAAAVSRWLFPRPADGNDVAVKYPFVLEPG